MTDYFVGPGGNDGNDGLTWANRFLTLNAAEDEPVVPGDEVYVGPGVYREVLEVDVDGNVTGGPITYIGDVSGENTDGIGGIVRITGSDNDTTRTRDRCIASMFGADYRTFRGFYMDSTNEACVKVNGTNHIYEDCVFENHANIATWFDGANQADHTLRRCMFICGTSARGIYFRHTVDVSNAGHLVENCIFLGSFTQLDISNVGGITVKNSTFLYNRTDSVDITSSLAGGQTVTVNNCVFFSGFRAMNGTVTGEVIEDYNSIIGMQTPRTNVDTGANSNTYPPYFIPPVILDGFQYPWWFGELSEWSPVARIAGTGESADDLLGVVRPTLSAKKSWGALQLREAERETGTVRAGSAALHLADAGDHQIFVPVTNTSTTFSVYGRFESEYAGTKPRLIVRQPGQADQVDTMAGAADNWEQLSLTFAPAAAPPYVVIILRSLNTSIVGDYDTYFDDLDVS